VSEGFAPLGVVFSAVDVAPPPDGDFATFQYSWDYGDGASGVWPTSHRGRNSDTGFTGAHVYERPGTYTCVLTVVASDGRSRSYSQRISVAGFGGATYYVSDVGNDANSGLSEDAPWRTIAKVQANLGSNRRFLFRRGGAYDAAGTLDIAAPGPGLIGAYGSGARPVLRFRGTGILILRDDWRLSDLDLRGPAGEGLGVTLGAEGGIDRALLLRVATRDFGVGIGWSGIDHAPADEGVVVAECETTGAAVNGFFVGGRRLALIGNRVSDSDSSHVVRVWQANRAFIAHNVFVRPGGDRHSLKLHGPPAWESMPKTEYVVVSSNLFQGNLLTVVVGPQNAISDEPVSHVLIERNRTLSVPMTLIDYVVEARDVTIRNNVMDGTLSPRFTGVGVQAGGVVRAPGRIRIENNTMYKGSAGVEAHMAVVEAGAFDVLIRNNFGSFPRVAANARGVVQGGHPGMVVESNLLSDVPGFADAADGDFHLLPSSPALNRALPSIRVKEDYDESPRGSSPDLGAYER
jgi:hypothetical protein